MSRAAQGERGRLNRYARDLASAMVRLQLERPVALVSVVALSLIVSLGLALRLTLRTGFESLLPESRPSVTELRRVSQRVSGMSMLFVVLEGERNATASELRSAGDALVTELERLGPPWVSSAETGPHAAIQFLEPRAGLFAPLPRLEQVRDEIQQRFDYEVAKQMGTLIDDEPPPPVTAARIRALLGVDEAEQSRFPDGYYQSADGRTLVVAVRSQVPGGDFSRGSEALTHIRGVVQRVLDRGFRPQLRYGFAGDLASGVSEYQAVQRDLTSVGELGAALIAGVVVLFYLRLRTLVALLLTIGIGVAWTFGVTALTIGHLNVATGFLFTIIAGNGINFSILYMTRYLEARRAGSSIEQAIRLAHRDSWAPTLTASLAASAAYGSLIVTDFRGFRDFGYIGGIGMLLCWVATYVTLPAVLALFERVTPLSSQGRGVFGAFAQSAHGGVAFGAPFAALVRRFPRAIVVISLATSGAGYAALARYIASDPMEYDVRRLRSDMSARSEEIRLNHVADSLTGFVGLDGMAILVDRVDQVAPLRAALEQRRDRAPRSAKPFRGVHSIDDFVPADQLHKIPVLEQIRDQVLRARARGVLSGAEFQRLAGYLPPADLKPFGMSDLPEAIARPFTEADGTRGKIVYLSPVGVGAVDDAHYLLRWADSYRETKLPDGSVIRGSGRAVIYADMWSAVLEDIPRAVVCSLLATILVVTLAFRGGAAAPAVLGSLVVGVGWLGLALAVLDIRLNFLNFIALPITFGIGVDYGVNLMQRYRAEGAGGALRAVSATGGAVVLCSLTTILGYVALVGSTNGGVRSLGVLAALGEVCCLLAAVLALPAALVWRDNRSHAFVERLGHG